MNDREKLINEWLKVCNTDNGQRFSIEQEAGYWLNNFDNPVATIEHDILKNPKFANEDLDYWNQVHQLVKSACL